MLVRFPCFTGLSRLVPRNVYLWVNTQSVTAFNVYHSKLPRYRSAGCYTAVVASHYSVLMQERLRHPHQPLVERSFGELHQHGSFTRRITHTPQPIKATVPIAAVTKNAVEYGGLNGRFRAIPAIHTPNEKPIPTIAIMPKTFSSGFISTGPHRRRYVNHHLGEVGYVGEYVTAMVNF
jgi:hypothetical protein